jgi:actin beta/gamma 1
MSAPTVVVDLGSAFTRSGYGGDSEPVSIVSTIVGRPRVTQSGASGASAEICVGAPAYKRAAQLSIRYPVENRVVASFDDFEVLLTLSALCPDGVREQVLETVMEKFRVPAFFGASPAAMSLYAAGVTSGFVVDAGDASTVVTPVYQCLSLPYFARRLDVGGRHVNDALRKGLVQAGYHFPSSAERELIADMKEHLCFVSEDPAKQKPIERPFMAPGGAGEVKISREAYMAPEVLFRPDLIGVDHPGGTAQLVADTICGVDDDIRDELCRTVLLAGGSTMFDGYAERLGRELKEKMGDVPFQIVAPLGRKISAWVGGSIIASVDTFEELWISKKEYEEVGKAVLAVKSY